MTCWGGGPLSQLGAEAPAANEACRALCMVSTGASVSGLVEGETCFAVLWFLSLLL
jgi:hypothetical protein